jgi:hypothetical protein
MASENAVMENIRGKLPAHGEWTPILTFCGGPELRALEALARMSELDLEERATSIAIEKGDVKPEEPRQVGDIERKPFEDTLSCVVRYLVLDALEPAQRRLQETRVHRLKVKEGFQQILEFLFNHPEIERARPEYFTQDDPAYRILRRKRGKWGETSEQIRQRIRQGIEPEWTDYDVPYDRPMAAYALAAEEALLKAEATTSAAIDRALAPFGERANNPEAE